MKLARLIKMCLNEKYSRDRAGRHLADKFPFKNSLKQGDALSPLLFSFVLYWAIEKVWTNQEGFKLNRSHQLLVYADVSTEYRILWNRRFNTVFTRARHLSVPCAKSVQSPLLSYFLETHFNIILPSTARSSKWSPYSRFRYQIPVGTSVFPSTCHMHRPTFFHLLRRIMFGEEYGSQSS